MKARKAMFAGSWYPDSAAACEREITSFIKKAKTPAADDKQLVGGIVPHAGWYFSGKIACSVIHRLRQEAQPDVIVVFGMHLHPASPRYIMTEGFWETPFGDLPIASGLARELATRFEFKIETAGHYSRDNTIELQLPFIKYFFENTAIVPMGMPPAKESLDVARAVVEIARGIGLRLKVLGSTDLTHYGLNYGFAPKGVGASAVDWVRNENDRRILDAMIAMDPKRVILEALESQNACCAGAAAAAIAAAKEMGAATAETVAYATSFDKSPGDSFVGYAGVVF
ncbi:MAG: AmmeMemoRadiSam system protein B [Thermodesulfobacteriota bacterium]